MVAEETAVIDGDLGQTVLAQVRRHPELNDTELRIAVDRGVVRLTGLVNTDAERAAIEAVVKTVHGVEAIASDIRLKASRERSDVEIARDALGGFRSLLLIPAHAITIAVRDGRVTLEGQVHFELQKLLAEAAVRALRGVTAVSNYIKIKPPSYLECRREVETPRNSVQTEAGDRALYGNDLWIDTGEGEPG